MELKFRALVFVGGGRPETPEENPRNRDEGGLVAQRHNGARDLVTSFLGKLYTNVEVEPQLQPLDNEQFNLRSKVTSPQGNVRLDMKAGGLLVSRSYSIF